MTEPKTIQLARKLTNLGEMIFYDRYAKKSQDRTKLELGQQVIVCLDPLAEYAQRELAIIKELNGDEVVVWMLNRQVRETVPRDHVDIPIETFHQGTERMAVALAKEEEDRVYWTHHFQWSLLNGFVPAGRVWAGAGVTEELTCFNCYVLPPPRDSRGGIFEAMTRMVEVLSRGGGVGMPMMTLRPRFAHVKGVNGRSSGSVSWADLYSYATGLVEQGGSRRGALMIIQYDWHPDILEFITSKNQKICGTCNNPDNHKLKNCNISIAVSDAFMQAVKDDAMWDLKFPDTAHEAYDTEWNGDIKLWESKDYPVIVYKTLPAREIWDAFVKSSWSSAEPGLFFVDRYNKMSNSNYYQNGKIWCTNPCGEQGLPGFFEPDGSWGGAVCNLGHLNLTDFLIGDGMGSDPAEVDWEKLRKMIPIAVRFMDNIIDMSFTPFDEVSAFKDSERRVGFGTMGLGEMLIRCGIRYGKNPECLDFVDKLYRFICVESYRASCMLAKEKGTFPLWDPKMLATSGFLQTMPEKVRKLISKHGLRNVTLLTQAPTGSVGTMMDTSTGIEPYPPWWSWERKGRLGSHIEHAKVLQDYLEAHPEVAQMRSELSQLEQFTTSKFLPRQFVHAGEMSPEDHVFVQSKIQRWTDSSISKTINLPNSYTEQQVGEFFLLLDELGCKGGTVYRDGSRHQQVLSMPEDTTKDVAPQEVEVAGFSDAPDLHPSPTGVYPLVGTAIQTALGKLHVKMGLHPSNNMPFEIWASLSKGGTSVNADKEAIARLASLILRLQSPVSPLTRIRMIIDQLKGIGGGDSHGFGPKRVLSVPDAMAKALVGLLGRFEESGGTVVSLLSDSDAPPSTAQSVAPPPDPMANRRQDICPSCNNATLMLAAGCESCPCGFSRC